MLSAPAPYVTAATPGAHANAGGRVRGEPNRRLVAQRVQRQDRRFLDDLEERQHEVAGDAEDLLRAVVAERVQQGLADVHRGAATSSCEFTSKCEPSAASSSTCQRSSSGIIVRS